MTAAASPFEKPRMNRVQFRTWFASAMGILIDGFDLFVIGAVISLIGADLGLSSVMKGWVAASSLLGSLLGAVVFGRLTDRFGRRLIYLLDLGFFVVFSVGSALAWDAWSLLTFRFLLGVAIGADYPITAALVSESVPTHLRGKATGGVVAAFPAGALIGVITAFIVVEAIGGESAWRWVLGLGTVPALCTVFFRAQTPESPRWLVSRGRLAEAQAAAFRLTGEKVSTESLAEFEVAGTASLPSLLRRPLLKRTALSVVPWFCFDVAVFPIGMFVPTVIALAFHETPQQIQANLGHVLMGAVGYNIVQLVGMATAAGVVERLGRIRLQVIGFALVAAGIALLILAHTKVLDSALHAYLVIAGLTLVAFFQGWPAVSTFLLPAELFSTGLRGTAQGLAAGAGKLGASAAVFAFPIVIADLNLAWTLSFCLAAALTGLVVTSALRIETSGKSLEELARG